MDLEPYKLHRIEIEKMIKGNVTKATDSRMTRKKMQQQPSD